MNYERKRHIACADTQEQAEGTRRLAEYDANNNVISSTDAKGESSTWEYGALDRKG